MSLFKVHILNNEGIASARILEKEFTEFLETLNKICGTDGRREMAIVKTKLQEASFFAKRAMAMKPENQK